MSEDVEHSGFCRLVDTDREQWRVDYSPAFRDMEYGGFCGTVDTGGE